MVAEAEPSERCEKLVTVAICYLRASLRQLGFPGAIETVWGFGYRMPPVSAVAISQALDIDLRAKAEAA